MAASRGIYTKTSSGLVAAANTGPTFLSDDASISAILNTQSSGARAILVSLINAGIPPALATNPTVVAAAVTAVNTQVSGLDIITGTDKRANKVLPTESGYLWAITDSANRVLIGVQTDGSVVGKVTLQSGQVTTTTLAPAVTQLMSQVLPLETGYLYAITDSLSRILFGIRDTGAVVLPRVELGAGTVTEAAIAPAVVAKFSAPKAPRYYAEVTGTTPNRSLFRNDLSTGTRTLVTSSGDPHDAVLASDGKAVLFTDSAGARKAQLESGLLVPDVSLRDSYAFWGDSMTFSSGSLMENAAMAELGLPNSAAFNGGVGGQTSTEIGIRAGAVVPLVTFPGGTLPTSTADVPITVSPAGDYRTGTGTWVFGGTLAGVPGSIVYTLDTTSWTFHRYTAGTADPVPANTPFIVTQDTHQTWTSILWLGRNNLYAANTGSWRLEQVARDVQSFIDTRAAYAPRYLVVGQINATTETSTAATGSSSRNVYNDTVRVNTELAAQFGGRYYNLRRDFIDNGLAVAGITATSADLAAIAGDAPPPSLMNPAGDHPSDTAGYQTIGKLIARRIVAMGWRL